MIDAVLGFLSSMTNTYVAQAQAFYNTALSKLYENPFRGKHPEFDYRQEPANVSINLPTPPQDRLGRVNLPNDPDISDYSDASGHFQDAKPYIPDRQHDDSDAPEVPGFFGTPPPPPSLSIKPKFPSYRYGRAVDLVEPKWIDTDPVTAGQVAIPKPRFSVPNADYFLEYHSALAEVSPEFEKWRDYLESIRSTLAPAEPLLLGSLRNIINRKQQAMTEQTEHDSFLVSKYDIEVARNAAIDERDRTSVASSGVFLGATAYADLRLRLDVMGRTTQGASKVAIERMDVEVKQLSWAIKLSANLITTALDLLARCASIHINALTIVISAAADAFTLMEEFIALKKQELSIVKYYNDLTAKYSELLIEAEKSKIRCIEADLANIENIAEYNKEILEAYKISSEYAKTNVEVYTQRISYVAALAELDEIELSIFSTDVDVFKAEIAAAQAILPKIKALVAQDASITQTELLKLKTWKGEITAHKAEIEARANVAYSQAKTSKDNLEAYIAKASALQDYLSKNDRMLDLAIRSINTNYEAERQKAFLEVQAQESVDSVNLAIAKEKYESEMIKFKEKLSEWKIESSKLFNAADISIKGADTMAKIAQSALAGFNAVGLVQTSQEA